LRGGSERDLVQDGCRRRWWTQELHGRDLLTRARGDVRNGGQRHHDRDGSGEREPDPARPRTAPIEAARHPRERRVRARARGAQHPQCLLAGGELTLVAQREGLDG
jgi:hypothetical protein